MPILPFDSLPDAARVWVFGSERALDDTEAARLLAEVDRFLAQWHAHGRPLAAGRDWCHDRFLTIAVDERAAGASGCSIDGLYRTLRALETQFGTGLLGGGLLFYCDGDGAVVGAGRDEFVARANSGDIGRDTIVFDLTVDTLGAWRERFEAPVHAGWHARLMPKGRTAER